MSQFQLTPMDIIDRTGLGGFRAGMADTRSLMHSDSNLKSEDLLQQKTQIENEDALLKRPMTAAEQAFKLAQLEKDKAMVEDGTYEKGVRADVDMKIANAIGKMDDNQRKKIQDQSEATLRAAEELKDASPAYIAANYDRIYADMQKAGITKFPRTWTPEVAQQLDKAARAAWRTQKVLQDENQFAIQHKNAIDLQGSQFTNEMYKQDDQQKFLGREGALNRANQSAIAAGHDAATRSVNRRKIGETQEEAEAALDSGTASYDQILRVERKMRAEIKAELTKDPASTMAKLDAFAKSLEGTPEERAAAQQKVDQAVSQNIVNTYGADVWERLQLKKQNLKNQGADKVLEPTKPAAKKQTFDALPDPAKFKGKIIRNDETGERHQSDGTKWTKL